MDWFAPIDAYCERLGPGLLAEPLNALSNAAFFIAALWAARAGDRGATDASVKGYASMLKFLGLCHRAGIPIVGPIEHDRSWEWIHVLAPDGNLYEFASALGDEDTHTGTRGADPDASTTDPLSQSSTPVP